MPRIVTNSYAPTTTALPEKWWRTVRIVSLLRLLGQSPLAEAPLWSRVPPPLSMDTSQRGPKATSLESQVEAAYAKWRPEASAMSTSDLREFGIALGLERISKSTTRMGLLKKVQNAININARSASTSVELWLRDHLSREDNV